MNFLLRISHLIDGISDRVGRLTTWLVLIMAVISAANATVRYSVNWSSNSLLEIQWYLFSAVFLLCSGYTLMKNEHVRIDVISGRLSAKTRTWIDIVGLVCFFFPMVYLFLYTGWPFFMVAYQGGEMSSNAGGLIRWPAKLLLPVGFFLLGLQGISELIKRIAFLQGLIPDPLDKHGKSAEEELAEEIARTARGVSQ